MINGERITKSTVRWGMVGGGKGSQIGYVHRSAALRDRYFDLVAGAFDLNAERGRDFGAELGLDPARCYADYRAMFTSESAREDGIRAVSIATPNNTHYEISRAALEAGIHVICEKPLTFTTAEAEELQALAEARGLIIGVTYGYSGHQMIEEAARLVASGALGEIRLVNLQFAHGFHNEPVELANPAAKWRVDPRFAGPSYVLGDLATHPLYISEVICPDLKIRRLLCARQSFVASRAPLEDNAITLMEYEGGAFGTLWTSAVNAGSMHGQKIRIVGSKASVEWWDEHPNQLRFEVQGEPARILDRGMGYLHPSSLIDDRIGAGHPEGLFESWANLYYRFALAIEAHDAGKPEQIKDLRYPGAKAGVEGVRWVENCVRSADLGGVWVDYQ
ncbi:Gfo/Idh/MocA family oxidoreductase [Sinirhodobacter sp. WL0062]|uniref:Gfo/Idh/MocA family oxidoreductase n=1 Tax=Rhodobacter flavimaris TaxID=2907145 RepID=A0ABS8Z4K9_9RHOB|nr:Gfo/Idh/MocA family oxidoreductase [Sinirhodobacter sp. WL0062]MCE5974870.1 Gfo/Idh/MocA family oxidoreductase [Sinirhodobacter sp. WL0062]